MVLTQGKRLKRHIEHLYDRSMVAAGLKSWPGASVATFSSWIPELYKESFPGKPLLTETRSAALWGRVVKENIPRNYEPLFKDALASESYKAYKRLTEFTARLPESEFYLTEESRALKRWIGAYEDEVRKLGAVSPFSVPELVCGLIRDGGVRLPGKVILAGFNELNPSIKLVKKALEARGVEVVNPSPKVSGGDDTGERVIKLLSFPDMESEVTALSRWVRATLKAGEKLAVVAPDLNCYKKIIAREFSSELYPSSVLPVNLADDAGRRVYDIFLSTTLSESPLAASALAVLKITAWKVDIDTLFNVLLDPYLNHNKEEYHLLGGVNLALRERNTLNSSLGDVIYTIKNPKAGSFDGTSALKGALSTRLSGWLDFLRENGGGSEFPSRWAALFSGLLKELGWPSPGVNLSSVEHQALEAFKSLITEFAELDEILGEVRWRSAVEALTKLASDKLHQPEGADAPVQVLGLTETPGLEFDYVWLLGADDSSLPGDAAPNPFLPVELQRDKSMPGSSPEVEEAYKRELLSGLSLSTTSFIASFPLVSDDKERRPAPLLTGGLVGVRVEEVLGDTDLASSGAASSRLRDLLLSSAILEDMPEGAPVPVGDVEREGFKGLTTILRDESACPFKAFAAHRLHASGLTEPSAGLTPMEKGNYAHEALKLFWTETKDLKGLKALMESDRLLQAVRNSVEAALRPVKKNLTHFINIERERLTGLLVEWLGVEAKRSDFIVKEIERKHELTLAGVTFNLRVDRVDKLPDGREVIMDYKTGRCAKGDWNTEEPPGRPKDPQMPLYSLTGSYSGVAYGALRPGECKFEGVAEDGDMLPGLKGFPEDSLGRKLSEINDWPSLTCSWGRAVNALADGFLSGVSTVDPVRLGRQDSACRYCDFTLLCRVTEIDMTDNSDDGEF